MGGLPLPAWAVLICLAAGRSSVASWCLSECRVCRGWQGRQRHLAVLVCWQAAGVGGGRGGVQIRGFRVGGGRGATSLSSLSDAAPWDGSGPGDGCSCCYTYLPAPLSILPLYLSVVNLTFRTI